MARRRRRRSLAAYLIVLIILLTGFIYSVFKIEQILRPSFIAIAEIRAQIIATNVVNEAINERMGQSIKYENLVTVREDPDGNIAWAQINIVEINRLTTQITLTVQEQFTKYAGETIRIPLGQIIGSPIFARFGPRIPVHITPLGTVQTVVTDSFEEAGINQTRHKIYGVVHSNIRVVLPFSTDTISVTSQVPLIDTIYIGRVPNTYLNVPMQWR